MFDKRIQNLYVINPAIENCEVVFYGAGDESHNMFRYLVRLEKVKLKGIYDSILSKEEKEQWGIPLLSRSEFEALDRDTPIIIATKHMFAFQEMVHDCLELGFKNIITRQWSAIAKLYDINDSKNKIESQKENINFTRNLFADERSRKVFDTLIQYRITNDYRLLLSIREKYKQYFPIGEIFIPDENEIFIDAGSLDALTIRDLKEWSNDKYLRAYAFEPSKEDRVIVDEMIKFYNFRAESVAVGLYDKNGIVKFNTDVMGWSAIEEKGNTEIKVVSLDAFWGNRDEKITYIKMDIEGSEMKALRGAIEIIKRDHPKLAICVYHKFNDLWEIPMWINENFPGYKFYLRHHSVTDNETVLYAKWSDII